ncbi:MAG: LysM domain-containing protein [Butyrivibrio sp.]|nr:LysM domain-containing protein [Acetatifactor muris]MCM1560718.1 LysM domain-containing protein [Butyrivibrio sp.]
MSSPLTVHADSDPFEEEGRDTWEAGLEDPNGWDCKGCTTDKHITSSRITAGNGTITVTVNPVYSTEGSATASCSICIINEQQTAVSGLDGEYYYSSDLNPGNIYKPAKWSQFVDQSNTATFSGLPNGTTYYVYCIMRDSHGDSDHKVHYAKYLGTATPAAGASDGSASSANVSSGSSSQSLWTAYEDKVNSQIKTAESGSTIVMDEGVTTLSNAMMQELLEKGDVSLRLEFTYEGTDYVIIIPAGAALDDDIPWYGPLYLAAHFGNSAEAEAAPQATYVVKSGDTLSKIAAANHMTLKELLTKNPQIKDANKITAGKSINL